MLIAILVGVFALAFTFILTRRQKIDPSQLGEQRAVLYATGVEIICGDCCGSDDEPIKTYLDVYGNCARCGGVSYVLASDYGLCLNSSKVRYLEEYRGRKQATGVISAKREARTAKVQ